MKMYKRGHKGKKLQAILLKVSVVVAALSIATSSHAVLVDFTGGTVHQFGGATFTTDNTFSVDNVDYYEEGGVKFDFIGPSGNPFSYHVGDYYGVGNDVIHGHWDAGPFGDMGSINVEKLDNTAFDLNYFKITTNTANGGGAASGSEEVYINALADGVNISFSMLLPSDDWGFAGPNSEIYLGTEFDGIKAFSFTYGSNAVGFGLDEFFIDEAAPPPSVPVPAAVWLFGSGLLGLVGVARRKKA